MKKKVLAISLVVAMLALLAMGGSLAWLSDEDSAENVFTVGSVEVEQHEKEYDDQGNLVDFTQDKVLMPIVEVDDPAADDNYQDKVVTVENTGRNPAAIRTHIAIPTALVGYVKLDVNTEGKWALSSESTATIDGMAYTVYSYDYADALAVDATTEVLLNGVYLDSKVDMKENADKDLEFCLPNGDGTYTFSGFVVHKADGTSNKVSVHVATQAIQTEGFASVAAALATFTGSYWE